MLIQIKSAIFGRGFGGSRLSARSGRFGLTAKVSTGHPLSFFSPEKGFPQRVPRAEPLVGGLEGEALQHSVGKDDKQVLSRKGRGFHEKGDWISEKRTHADHSR